MGYIVLATVVGCIVLATVAAELRVVAAAAELRVVAAAAAKWLVGVAAAGSGSSMYIPTSYIGGNEHFKGTCIYYTDL